MKVNTSTSKEIQCLLSVFDDILYFMQYCRGDKSLRCIEGIKSYEPYLMIKAFVW